MSRHVDADAILDKYKGILQAQTDYAEGIRDVIKDIKDAPSIDIVRCKECKYWMDDRKDERDMGTCTLTHYFVDHDDFCSFGEREGE